jgi:DNA-nicking Smr family endonuclease
LSNNISNKDKEDWKRFVSGNDKLTDKEINVGKNKIEKKRTIDLHGFTLDEANKTIESFINKSFKEEVSKLIVVTGKGLHSKNESNPFVSNKLSILKYSIPEFIKSNDILMKKIIEIKDADIKDGGSGAFYIYLKKLK